MKKIIFSLLFVAILGAPIFALTGTSQFGVGMNVFVNPRSADASAFIGLCSSTYDLNISFAGYGISSGLAEVTSYSISGGLKNKILEKTYFTYGLLFGISAGQFNGIRIENGLLYGVYLGVQHELVKNLLLDFQYYPYLGQSYSSGGSTTQLNYYGNTVVTAISYLFGN
ncbi:MAG: hypothetical protein WC860_04265 [Candidatus Margulisiibacteriota bacterium]|jgi:hypothetical protein